MYGQYESHILFILFTYVCYVMYTPWYLCIFYYILYFKYYDICWRFSDLSVVVFRSCDFHMPKYLRQGTESLCPMETGQWHLQFYYTSKILEKIQADEGDIWSSSSLYTTRNLVVQDVGEFSANITHFMLMHSKVNC